MRDENRVRKILPVNLLLGRRPCLVVGGGNVAARKAGHLLDAGARVTVVSAAVNEAVAQWAKKRRLRHVPRNFRVGDVRGQFLVFAATDDPAVNKHVLACCRKQEILCNAADANWTRGDFVTPAICRKAGLIVTVSTGGRSCKTARIVKDKIARVIDTLAKTK